MNSGSAPQTTRSSTTMPTRSNPMVSCTSIAWAIATLVPTPSVEVASTGCRICASRLASNSPAKPPRPVSTSERRVVSTQCRIASTARSPAAMSTPAAAYALGSFTSGAGEGVGGPDAGGQRLAVVQLDGGGAVGGGVLQHVLPEPGAER